MTTQILPTDTGDLGEGLQARIADPLWMLFRQWTVRELTGESVGTPTRLTMKVELADFGDAPLEAEIEAESVLRDPVQRFRIAAETGRVLLSGATPTRALELQQAFPLTPADNSMRARLWSKTGMDGLSALASSELAAHERIRTSSWLEANYGIVPTGRWLPDQLAYDARVQVADGELAVSGYRGGRLDWTDFSLNRAPTQTETRTVEVIPSRVRFPGMPDRRFWSAEDRQVNFGELDVQPERVAQLVVSEFSVVFGDDWFSVPLSVPRGSLVRVLSVELIDAFGAVTSVPSYRVVDRDRPPTWDLWTLRGDTDLNPWHLVPAALSSPHEGSPIERVRLWRDEHSNRALVCEERSARAVGGHRTPQPVAPASSERSGWVFTLTPTPPVNWWPFDLQSREDSVQVDFRLTRFAGQGEPLTAAVTELEGVAISEDLLHLPQVVTRRWQLARRASGQRVLWLGRERRSTREPVVGRPLTYDNVEWIEP